MKITILSVGKMKEAFFRDAVEEYVKRLSRYCQITITEVMDEKTPEQASLVQMEQIKEKEAERIIKYVKEDMYVIALAIEGVKLDSLQFSEKMEKITIQGNSHICFIIGGSLGLHDKILKNSDLLLSFSDMTFPHQLMRVILTEQIYRSFRIKANEPYHK